MLSVLSMYLITVRALAENRDCSIARMSFNGAFFSSIPALAATVQLRYRPDPFVHSSAQHGPSTYYPGPYLATCMALAGASEVFAKMGTTLFLGYFLV